MPRAGHTTPITCRCLSPRACLVLMLSSSAATTTHPHRPAACLPRWRDLPTLSFAYLCALRAWRLAFRTLAFIAPVQGTPTAACACGATPLLYHASPTRCVGARASWFFVSNCGRHLVYPSPRITGAFRGDSCLKLRCGAGVAGSSACLLHLCHRASVPPISPYHYRCPLPASLALFAFHLLPPFCHLQNIACQRSRAGALRATGAAWGHTRQRRTPLPSSVIVGATCAVRWYGAWVVRRACRLQPLARHHRHGSCRHHFYAPRCAARPRLTSTPVLCVMPTTWYIPTYCSHFARLVTIVAPELLLPSACHSLLHALCRRLTIFTARKQNFQAIKPRGVA